MRKKILIVIPVLILFGVMLIRSTTSNNVALDRTDAAKHAQNGEPDSAEPSQPEFIRIAAMGDMLPHETVTLRAKTPSGYDYSPFFAPVKEHLAESDIIFCNQESTSAGDAFGISGFPSFNAPIQFSADLKEFGCNTINLANNHIADKGQGAIDETLKTWAALSPLAVAGANSSQLEQDKVSYFEVSGMRFALLAFTDLSNNKSINNYGVNMFDSDLVTKLANEATKNSDYVIASAHWGVEDSSEVSESQKKWAQLLSAQGVDLIIGTGPHVIQPVDKIGETVVFYSIGNFLSSQLLIEELVGGIAFIDVPVGGGLPKLSFLPTFMNYTWSAADSAAGNLLARDNLSVNPLDKSASLIENSLFDTTANAQRVRVSNLLNKNVEVEILQSD